MSGFGSGPFGHGPFGSFDWSKQVLFRDLPEIDRRADVVLGAPLETFMDSIKPSFDELLRFTRDFGSLRDADTVRTQFQSKIDVELLTATATLGGRVIEVLLEDPDPNDPFAPLGATSIGWILEDGAGRQFMVNAVHKLRDAGPTLELKGTAEEPTTARNASTELTGTVTFTEGSTTVTGVGTAFLTEVAVGQIVMPGKAAQFGLVDSVTDDFTIELTEPYTGEDADVVVGFVGTISDGAAVLRPPSLIELFGQDFGLEVDRHEPEAFQRSSVRNIEQWLNLKGAQRSYDIIGKIAGYRVLAFGLWRVGTVSLLTGTVEFTTGLSFVVGTGTAFLSEVTPGQFITPGVGIIPGIVSAVVDNETITLSNPYTGSSTGPGSPALVFDEPVPVGIPLDELFEAPGGSGKLYTTLAPARGFFDEIAADVIPLDLLCFETLDWTTEPITPPVPSPPDGTSVEDAIGIDTQALPIISTTSLGNGRWEIRVGPAVDLNNIIGLNSWHAEFPSIPGVRHFLETLPVEDPAGEWVFEILAGTSPSFGATVNVGYQCRPAPSCDYCRASVIRVEVVPAEILTDPDVLLDGALPRLSNKLLQVIPAHVRATEIVHLIGPVQGALNIQVQASISIFVTAAASVGYYYDITPADELPIDPPHMVATGSVSTVP